ncbi:MAG: glycosyltransferase family 87 protein, partial [Actinocrinis sp.]
FTQGVRTRRVVTRGRLVSAALPAFCWAWTRAVLLMFTFKVIPYISHSDIVGDVRTYSQWAVGFAKGGYPQHDPTWQYPPGAAIVVALPRAVHKLTGMSYFSAFYTMALASDLIIFLAVLYRCWHTAHRRMAARVDYTGAWAYIAAIFALGPIVYGRYDVIVTMLAVLGLVATTRGTRWTWRLRGVAIGIGALVKVWPAAIAVGLPKRTDGRRALLWAVVSATATAVALAALWPGSWGFLAGQQHRGLEVESVPATPFLIARRLGYPGVIRNQYGAFEITGPGVAEVAALCELLTVAGFAWLLWWRRKADLGPGRWSTALYFDASLVAVMIAMVTSRVLSPQYLVWLVALIALCLTLSPPPEADAMAGRHTGSTALTGPCWLLLSAISVTQVDFPLLFPRLVHGSRFSAWFMTGRNMLLVAATLWAARCLWRAIEPPPPPKAPDDPVTS